MRGKLKPCANCKKLRKKLREANLAIFSFNKGEQELLATAQEYLENQIEIELENRVWAEFRNLEALAHQMKASGEYLVNGLKRFEKERSHESKKR